MKVRRLARRLLSPVAVGLLASVAACGGGESDIAPTTTAAPITTALTTTAAPPPAVATTAVEEQPQAVIERDLAFATHNGAPLTLNLCTSPPTPTMHPT